MKYSIISDVHVKDPGDSAEEILLLFLNNPDVINSDAIILLGDIFDLMIGPHSQYFSRFQKYFSSLERLLAANKKIYYVDGNHDFHLQKLYKNFFKIHKHLNSRNFIMKSEFIFKDADRSIYMAHGDHVEIGNNGHRLFKAFVLSSPLTFLANNIIPYFAITKVGETSSKISRTRNESRYSKEFDLSGIKDNFRKSAEVFHEKNPHDIIVLGHSHVKDYYKSNSNFEYVNNGYAQHSKSYISIENGIVTFKDL